MLRLCFEFCLLVTGINWIAKFFEGLSNKIEFSFKLCMICKLFTYLPIGLLIAEWRKQMSFDRSETHSNSILSVV